MMKTIYIAGPDVFRADAKAIGAAKKALCQQYGFNGLFPLDNELEADGLSPHELGLKIFRANVDLMDQADLVIANMMPFRGPGMDGGTAFELGYMAGQGKPVFGYTLDSRRYATRVEQNEAGRDANGLEVEAFDMADNLMLEGAIVTSGAQVVVRDGVDADPEAHLIAFEYVLLQVKDHIEAAQQAYIDHLVAKYGIVKRMKDGDCIPVSTQEFTQDDNGELVLVREVKG